MKELIGKVFRHRVRKTEYEVIEIGKFNTSDGEFTELDRSDLVVYRNMKTGSTEMRVLEEFLDGRFEELDGQGGIHLHIPFHVGQAVQYQDNHNRVVSGVIRSIICRFVVMSTGPLNTETITVSHPSYINKVAHISRDQIMVTP